MNTLARLLVVMSGMALVIGCERERETPSADSPAEIPRYRRLMKRIERGEYTTCSIQAEPRVLVTEVQELFKYKEAYPWLIKAVGSTDQRIADTARYGFRLSHLPGALTVKRLQWHYDVPDNALRLEGIWKPPPNRVFELPDWLMCDRGADGDTIILAPRHRYIPVKGGRPQEFAFFDVSADPASLCVVRLGDDGYVEWCDAFQGSAWEAATALQSAEWLKDGRLFAVAHVNPSLGLGILVEVPKRSTEVYEGRGFIWSPDVRHVAYFQEPPHFGAPGWVPAKIMIDHKKLAEIPRNSGRSIVWKGDTLEVRYQAGDGQTTRRFQVEVHGE